MKQFKNSGPASNRSTILDMEMQNYGIFHGEAVAQIQISKELEPP